MVKIGKESSVGKKKQATIADEETMARNSTHEAIRGLRCLWGFALAYSSGLVFRAPLKRLTGNLVGTVEETKRGIT